MHFSASCQPAQNSRMNNEMKTGSLLGQTGFLYLGICLGAVPVNL